jgi:hypothetical protein
LLPFLLACLLAWQGPLPDATTRAQELETVDPGRATGAAPPRQSRSTDATEAGNANGRPILSGTVSLQSAMAAEQGRVDWYGWYLKARQYIASHGGLRCEHGTPILFRKTGQMSAMTNDPMCQASTISKRFPLPVGTHVDTLILPTRPGAAPPASPEELMRFLETPVWTKPQNRLLKWDSDY